MKGQVEQQGQPSRKHLAIHRVALMVLIYTPDGGGGLAHKIPDGLRRGCDTPARGRFQVVLTRCRKA